MYIICLNYELESLVMQVIMEKNKKNNFIIILMGLERFFQAGIAQNTKADRKRKYSLTNKWVKMWETNIW